MEDGSLDRPHVGGEGVPGRQGERRPAGADGLNPTKLGDPGLYLCGADLV